MKSSLLKFSANLGFLWTDRALPDAIYAAASAGFDAVECHWPYDSDSALVTAALKETGLPMVGINTHKGGAGMFGLSALPDQRIDARDAIITAINYAATIGAKNIHVMAGVAEGDKARDVFLDNLAYACDEAAKHNIGILIEPINTVDVPGYFLTTADQAAQIIHNVNHPALRLMFDCYHCARMNDDVTTMLEKHVSIIGHIQFAGVPDRGRPDRGTLNYASVFATIQNVGWSGYLGAEYKPGEQDGCDGTDQSLGWMLNF